MTPLLWFLIAVLAAVAVGRAFPGSQRVAWAFAAAALILLLYLTGQIG